MSDKSNLTFCFPPSLPPCMAEFANVLCVCFGRRSFELVRTVFYLRGMSAIVRTGPRRSSSHPRSSAKIRLSRGQKQILFAFCRGEVFKVQPKIRIGPGTRANLAEVWAIGDNALYRTDNRLPTPLPPSLPGCRLCLLRIVRNGIPRLVLRVPNSNSGSVGKYPVS